MAAGRVCVAVDPDIVGRIEEGSIDQNVLADDLAEKSHVSAIAAPDLVFAENPDVAGFRSRFGGDRGNDIVVGIR